MPRRKRETWSTPAWRVRPPPSLAYAVAEAARRENVSVPEMLIRLVVAELHRRAGTPEPSPPVTAQR
jgi:hypothetical protein